MEVQVHLYAALKKFSDEARQGGAFAVSIQEGTTLGDLIEVVRVPRGLAKIVFVNGIRREDDHVLAHGDRVGLFPAIAGG